MAQWQAPPQPQADRNGPTLMTGQTIAVNKYTVQVERYLSQGTHHSSAAITMIPSRIRWLRTRLSRQNCNTSIQHDTSCLEANSNA